MSDGAGLIDHGAPWVGPHGLRIGADRMRSRTYLAAWQAMRATMPMEHWSVEACDAMTDAVLQSVREWLEWPDV